MNQSDKKSNNVVIIGIILIVLVFVFTFFRSGFGKDDSADTTTQKKDAAYPKITVENFKERMKSPESVQVVDIRGEDDYKIEHIVNSINALGDDTLAGISQQKTTILVGYPDKPQEYVNAIDYLEKKKIKNVFVLEGGIEAWKRNGGNTISIGNPNSFTDNAKVTYITPDDLKKSIIDEKNSGQYIVDVRTGKAFAEGHIPGAVNIYLDAIEKSQDSFPRGKQIVVYGENELEGFQGGVRLYDLHFLAFQALQGGFLRWKEKGFPIEK